MRRPTSPNVNPGDFVFLTTVYKRECDQVRHSPEQAVQQNLAKANRVAGKLLAALNIYGESNFPTLDIDDPCQNMKSLPLVLKAGYGASWSFSKLVSVHYSPEHPKPEPLGSFGFSLGSLTVYEPYRPDRDEPRIGEITLYRPWADGRGPTLGQYPRQTERGFQDGYLVNVEAMNLIGMVDQYLEKLGQNRLILLESSSI